jgi:hypothetical protein
MDLFGSENKEVLFTKKESVTDPKVKRFKALLTKIENLEQKLELTKNEYEQVLAYYKKHLEPVEKERSKVVLNLIKAAYHIIPNLKLSKSRLMNVTQMMIDELESFASIDELDDEGRIIYENISHTTIEEVKAETNVMGLEMLQEMLQANGIELDLEKYDVEKLMRGDPEVMQKFMYDMMQENFKQKEEAFKENTNRQKQNSNANEKKKTKKQIELEAKRKEKEEFEKRSLKSLYNSLAKILHPDIESNETLKIEKEEWMKKLTVAYQNQDLATMINIEIHWLKNSSFDPSSAPEKQYNTYVSFLNERVQELNDEIFHVKHNPKYFEIEDFLQRNAAASITKINNEKKNLKKGYQQLDVLTALLKDTDIKKIPTQRKELNYYVEMYMERMQDDENNFFNF